MKRVDDHVEVTGEEARQGRVVLNTPLRFLIFTGGLAALAGFVLVLLFMY